jgi:hypothetical protein
MIVIYFGPKVKVLALQISVCIEPDNVKVLLKDDNHAEQGAANHKNQHDGQHSSFSHFFNQLLVVLPHQQIPIQTHLSIGQVTHQLENAVQRCNPNVSLQTVVLSPININFNRHTLDQIVKKVHDELISM